MVGGNLYFNTYNSATTTCTPTSQTSYTWNYSWSDSNDNKTYKEYDDQCVDLDWWEKEKKKVKDQEKMRSKWKNQRKQHRFHQSKWGTNKPRRGR